MATAFLTIGAVFYYIDERENNPPAVKTTAITGVHLQQVYLDYSLLERTFLTTLSPITAGGTGIAGRRPIPDQEMRLRRIVRQTLAKNGITIKPPVETHKREHAANPQVDEMLVLVRATRYGEIVHLRPDGGLRRRE